MIIVCAHEIPPAQLTACALYSCHAKLSSLRILSLGAWGISKYFSQPLCQKSCRQLFALHALI